MGFSLGYKIFFKGHGFFPASTSFSLFAPNGGFKLKYDFIFLFFHLLP